MPQALTYCKGRERSRKARQSEATRSGSSLFQIRSECLDQIVRRVSLFIGWSRLRVENVKANVNFDHFRHESIHGPAASRNVVQDLGAFAFVVERSLDGFDLSSNSPDTIEQLFPFFCCVSHKKFCGTLTRIPPAVYSEQGSAFAFPTIPEERRPIHV